MHGVEVWRRWAKNKPEEEEDMVVLLNDEDALVQALIRFLNHLKEQISVDTIFYVLLSIQKFLFEQESGISFFFGLVSEEFSTNFNDVIIQKLPGRYPN